MRSIPVRWCIVFAIVLNFSAVTVPASADDLQIEDEGEAGTPVIPPDHAEVTDQVPTSGVSLDQSLATLNPQQRTQLDQAIEGELGMNLNTMGLTNGSGHVRAEYQWFDPGKGFLPDEKPAEPNTNHAVTTFTGTNGMTVTIAWGATGHYGTLGSTDNGGGGGVLAVLITDADGNRSRMRFEFSGAKIQYTKFHLEQMVRDGAQVTIDGPDEIDEDTVNTWTCSLPDSNLPAEDDTAWDIEWDGPPRIEWTADNGVPSSGQDSSFSSRFLQPGDFRVSVEVERDYRYKVNRPQPNPAYTEGVDPVSEAFIQVEAIMTGTIRGRAEKSGPVHDITPPDLSFVLATRSKDNKIEMTEDPEDKEPPKTVKIRVEGVNFDASQAEVITASAFANANNPVLLRPPVFSSQVDGIWLWDDVRFRLRAEVSDNATSSDNIDFSWKIENKSKGTVLLPEGRTPYYIVRFSNEPDGDEIVLSVRAQDQSSNVTLLEIPLHILGRSLLVNQLSFDSKKRKR